MREPKIHQGLCDYCGWPAEGPVAELATLDCDCFTFICRACLLDIANAFIKRLNSQKLLTPNPHQTQSPPE